MVGSHLFPLCDPPQQWIHLDPRESSTGRVVETGDAWRNPQARDLGQCDPTRSYKIYIDNSWYLKTWKGNEERSELQLIFSYHFISFLLGLHEKQLPSCHPSQLMVKLALLPGPQKHQDHPLPKSPTFHNWLVVWTPLKNMKVNWDDYPQYMEK